MRRILISLTLLCSATLVATPAWSALFSACKSVADEPKPEWVNKPDYSFPGHFFAIGSAELDGRSKDEQIRLSEGNAKSHLVQQIQVTIKAEIEQSTRVTNQTVQQDELSRVTVNSEEVLRGLTIKSHWVDKATCAYYTLVVVSKESIAQVKQEKIMKSRLEQFNKLLAEGVDHEKNADIKQRQKYLEGAQVLLINTDFKFLPDELAEEVFKNKLNAALEQIGAEAAQAQGRMALFAINKASSTLPESVVGKMLDQLRSGNNTTDRLMVDCIREEDCISRAKERGFTMLTLLTTNTQVATSQMGALKGTLTVSKTVYDIESRKVLNGPETVSTQVIGWSATELDWGMAAEKAMKTFK